MKNSEPRIPKEIVPEVFALAARLQEQKQQSYSLEELTQIGAEVKISPEFIQRLCRRFKPSKSRGESSDRILRRFCLASE